MTTQPQQPSLSPVPVPRPEAMPATPAAVAQIRPRGDEPRPYWGDRLFLLFGLGCALLINLMNVYDFLKGWLNH